MTTITSETGYQCFHCLHNTVYWSSDFSFEDYGLEGEGIIHVCHCGYCGADIEYYIRLDEEEECTSTEALKDTDTTQP